MPCHNCKPVKPGLSLIPLFLFHSHPKGQQIPIFILEVRCGTCVCNIVPTSVICLIHILKPRAWASYYHGCFVFFPSFWKPQLIASASVSSPANNCVSINHQISVIKVTKVLLSKSWVTSNWSPCYAIGYWFCFLLFVYCWNISLLHNSSELLFLAN